MMNKFDDNKNQRNYSDKEVIKRLYHFIKPKRKYFVIALVLTIILVILQSISPLVIGRVTEILTSNLDDRNYIIRQVSVYLFILLFGAIFLSSIIQFITGMMVQKTGQAIVYDIRNDLFNHIQSLSIAQINSQPIGKMVTRITNDTNTLSEFFAIVIVNLFGSILSIIITFIIMLYLSVQLTLIVSILFPILVLATYNFNKVSRKNFRKVRGNISNMNSFLAENLSGMKVTQIFNQEEKKLKEFEEKNKSLKKSMIKESIVFGIFRPLIFVLFMLSNVLIIYFGVRLVQDSLLTIAAFVAFFGYISNFFNPIQQIADLFNQVQLAFASSEKIFEVLDQEPQIFNNKDSIEISDIQGKIEFKNVWFAYSDENWILKNVNFVISPNQTAAFVGATGAGKTTILALIVRNYEITKGQILIDDIDIKEIKIASLRKFTGQMLQDVFLFSGTIKDNITLRDEKYSLAKVKEVSEYINASSFIEKLPDNYDYVVKERGSNFSSGQRQLLSFARTLIHKPNIIILDEATANIDTETEKIIQEALKKMMNVGTMLIVAHRLSTIQHADKIIVLHKGQIVEEGNHQELLKKKGKYNKLYEMQFKNLE